ncbi:hypothetical protein NEILACOT_03541 [Neisseria lactamica ATCC 23970]|uniref:Uncharacterized protein n=1 Tax=Neisseria lactamica ATCC 23970 TaxID=546265 RepID=D0W7P1_NEILA|nr:hypothetical protein NEILACOT_03541 [Neisseria lactamica ATCC 23970]
MPSERFFRRHFECLGKRLAAWYSGLTKIRTRRRSRRQYR